MFGQIDTDIKTLWLRGLRSTNYATCGAYLRDKLNRFNGLGVLCDVLTLSGQIEWAWLPNANAHVAVSQLPKKPHTNLSTVPKDVAKTIGLTNLAQDKIANMCLEGISHDTLATWIEENI